MIGREFSHELLAAVVSMPADQLCDALEQLVNRSWSSAVGGPRGDLQLQARVGSGRRLPESAPKQAATPACGIVAVLESRAGERIEVTPELLAHHCTEAALTEKAISYWSAAGERASRHSASAEAVGHFRRAQALLEDA